MCFGLRAVYAVVDGDKAHVVSVKYLHSISHLKIIALPACHVLHNEDADFAVFHIVHHLNISGTVREPAAFFIVNIVPGVRQHLLPCVPL